MANTTFQQGRKPKNTWLAGKIKCGHCGYALKATHVPNNTGYFRCTKRTENKGCPGCGKIRKEEFEQFIFSAMQEKFKDFQIHDTAKLMQNYRDVLWNVEVSEQNLQAEFRAEYGAANGIQITDLDISNPRLEGDAQSIARSKKMLQLIDSSVNLIRERHKMGNFII